MTHTITLVGDVYVSKTEALHALSALFDTPINDSNPAHAVLNLGGGVVLSIEVPKFGEDLPLTVDLSSDDGDALEKVTHDVIDRVGEGLSWSMTVVGT
jgi:hypothetical protein